MTELEAAWLAGIIEGEGCLQYTERKRTEKRSGTQYTAKEVSVAIAMTDKDIVERCAAIMGTHVTQLKKRKGQTKDVYRTTTTRWDRVETILRAIRPWLGTRRGERADMLLDKCAAHTEWVTTGGRARAWAANIGR